MPFVSVTRLRVRSWRFVPVFFVQAFRSGRQAAAAPGNLATALLRDPQWTFWTSTVWTDEAAMRSFMMAGAHRSVMRRLLEWCDEASLVHWSQEQATLPTWSEAHRRLQGEGRLSKVHHPSPAHTAFEIPAPLARPSGQLRLR
jgi:hypothetical protein